MRSIFTLFFILFKFSVIGQIHGKLIDVQSQEAIPFAVIQLTELKIGSTSNEKGIFIFDIVPPNNFTLTVSAVGYEPFIETYKFTSDTLVISLVETHIEFENIEILASRNGLQRDNITYIERKSLKDLNTIKATNLGEAISSIAGVYNASTGNGISKPVVRGLSGVRIITLLNGSRIENQQWGSDHGMAVTSLGIGSVEIVKGPASLLYGSDALGGVVYFNDEDYAANKSFETTFSTSFETNGSNFQNQLGIKLSDKSIRLNTYVGWNTSKDFQLPNGNYLSNSMYEDKLAKIALGFNKKQWISNLRYTYLNSKVGIPGESEDSIPTLDSYSSTNSQRHVSTPFQHIQTHLANWENKFIIGKNTLTTLVGFSQNSLQEFEDSFQESAMELNLVAIPYTIKYDWRPTEKITLTSGVQGMHQINQNAPLAEERLIPNATTTDNGIFSLFVYNPGKTKIQIGIRGDLRKISVNDDTLQFVNNYSSFNFSTGLIHQFTKTQQIRFNIASGYRSPHTSELFANGSHDGALRYEIGSKALKNEQAFQADLTYEVSGEHISIFVNPFYNRIANFIALYKTDSIIDNLPVYTYQQLTNTYFFGTDIGLHFHPHFAHWLHVESSYSYIRGQEKSGTSLPLIPASRLLSTLRLEINVGKKINWKSFSAQLNYFFKQDKIGENEITTMDYGLINLATTINMFKRIDFSIGVKNLLNKTYYNNLSSLRNLNIPQPGINGYAQVIIHLQQKMK